MRTQKHIVLVKDSNEKRMCALHVSFSQQRNPGQRECQRTRRYTRVVIPGNPDPEFPGFGVFFPIPIPGLYV